MKRLLSMLLVAMMLTMLCVGFACAQEQSITLAAATGRVVDNMISGFTALYPDITVDLAANETASREQVLKTSIAAGDPADLCQYWGTRLNSFSDIGMCKDLRPYFSQETLDSVSDTLLNVVTGENGEIWGIPYSAVYHLMFYNKTMLDAYGFEVPQTWDDLTAIFARLKEDDIFGFCTNSVSMQDCMYGFTYSLLEEIAPGTSKGVAAGEISVAPGTPAGDAIATVIEQVKEWYEAGYWYPGDGGINCSPDDANAAFSQGRAMFIFNYSGALSIHKSSCDFEIGWILKPVKELGQISYENTEPDVLFVPSNLSEEQTLLAVQFLEYLLSADYQQKLVDAYNMPSVTGAEYQNVDPALAGIMAGLDSGSILPGINPTRTSSQMQTFVKQQVFAAPCSGMMTIDETLQEMERIRLEAIESK